MLNLLRHLRARELHEGSELAADNADLHWRMATVLTALKGLDNRRAALGHYASAISARGSLLDDENPQVAAQR